MALPRAIRYQEPILTGGRDIWRVVASVVIGGSVGILVPGTAQATAKIRVDVIGDSITDVAEPEITATLTDFDLYVSARPGTTMAQNFSTIEDAPTAPDWVIELGTNDVGLSNPDWAEDFATEVGLVAQDRCVELVTVGEHLPGNDKIAKALDAAMAGVASARHNFHLVQWGRIEYGNPAWLLPDHVHPTAAGAQRLADLERTALDRCQ